jgi:GNAT superfamily N-acetyltransferase
MSRINDLPRPAEAEFAESSINSCFCKNMTRAVLPRNSDEVEHDLVRNEDRRSPSDCKLSHDEPSVPPTSPSSASFNDFVKTLIVRMRAVLPHDGVPRTCDGMLIEQGTLDDYRKLASFHYRSAHPGGVCDVLRMVLRRPTVVGRFLGRRDDSQLIGVLVRSLPSLSCQLRDLATGNRYRELSPRERGIMLNREVRCISRVVIDPRLRGLGLAVRLVRHALQNLPPSAPTLRYTEALAAMGHVSPFFEKAGMTRFDRPLRSRPAHARVLDALDHLAIAPPMLASSRLIRERMAAIGDSDRRWLSDELRRWHRAVHRTSLASLRSMSLDDLLIAAREKLLLSPVYFIFAHAPASLAAD